MIRALAEEDLELEGGGAAVKNACPCGTMKRPPRPRPPRAPRPAAAVLPRPAARPADAAGLLGTAMGTAPLLLVATSGRIFLDGLREGLNLPA